MNGAGTPELRMALENGLGAPIASLRRRASSYATSHRVENLFLRMEDGRTLRLVFKDLSPDAVLAPAQGIRPALMQNPRREIEVYRRLLPRCGPVAPELRASTTGSSGRAWLFLDRVPGRPLWEHGRFATWLAAAAALGEFHGARPPSAAAARAAFLIRYDRAFYREWMERALEFQPSRRLERLVRAHERAVSQLLACPAQLIHGECFASNVLVAKGAGGIRLIDWESAALGPGVLDLAALATGWPEARRVAMCDAYAGALGRCGADLIHGLDCARLHLAVQMLGWSPRWRAPRAHRRDWLAEAEAAAHAMEA